MFALRRNPKPEGTMMTQPKDYIHKLDPTKRPPLVRVPEKIVADIGWYNQNRATARRFHPVNGIEGITIHATAGGTAGGALSWWKNPAVAASAHWLIPAEREADHGKFIIAAVYESLAAWHVRNEKSDPRVNGGRATINHWTLGIEVVNTQLAGDTYSDWQVQTTADLVRYCWAKYPNFKWIFSHAAVDPTRRLDPGVAFPWERFLTLVNAPAMQGDDDGGRNDLLFPAVNAGPHDGIPCCGND